MMQIFSGASSGAWFEKAQRFGKSFMLPIAILPAAGLLLGSAGRYRIQIRLLRIHF